ncbi:FAD:protein FMN transferase [bacterium 1XD8-76]|nr:FAD:protein FMN transferase [bacterium 1XD8-76]
MNLGNGEKKIIKRLAGVIILSLICLLVWGHSKYEGRKSCTKQIFAMDTVMDFTAYGKDCEEAVDAAIKEVQRLDALFSTGDDSSELSILNRTGSGRGLSNDTIAIFRRGLEIYADTDGLFDFTVYPLMCLWGFPTKEYRVPSPEDLQEVLPLVDASKVRVGEDGMGEIHLGEGQQADFGGIAKGYASERVMEIYEEYGVTSGMVSLGGNVQVLGKKPDDSAWRVGIQDPEGDRGELAAVLEAEDCAVVTSGGYERYFQEDGNTYIHILDPRTGRPVEGDLASVTVVSEDGTLTDALSTALYIMGFDEAVSYWRENTDTFDMVLITVDGKLYATKGIAERIRTERELSGIT